MSTVQATGSHVEPSVPVLPDGLTLKYVAEGAANVIWRISLPDGQITPPPTIVEEYSGSTPPPSEVDVGVDIGRENGTTKSNGADIPTPATIATDYTRLLLRLRKCLPSSESNLLAYEYLSSVIMPLFPPGVMVGQELVSLPPALVMRANDTLHALEKSGIRPAHRQHLYLAGDPRPNEQQMGEGFAFLLEDMTPDTSLGEFLLEFKAKWLIQSPNAPGSWKRCRTCALRLRKYSRAIKKGKRAEWRGLCPFDLASNDQKRTKNAVRWILQPPRSEDEKLVERVTVALMGCPQLSILKELQASLDPKGILKADHKSKEFLTAMTLRDCTFYVKVSPTDVQARLGDFDVKSGEAGKSDYWIENERELIEEGWYTGTEEGDYPWKAEGLEVVCRA
ncbi:Inositol-pentakisphosphate 2-kinase [Arthrobotrys musiformis]|uniref:Inositol-pentakisphosphate 2-kinase n=1 Tax=Arthrobotrys musiformis TaxID=47236 RepID=A0AAV9VZ96_9PEZI